MAKSDTSRDPEGARYTSIIGIDLELPVNQVTVEQPWRWLLAGWQDFSRAGAVSLFFGVAIALISALLIFGFWQSDLRPYAFPLAAGFFFIAPLLGVAFYDISRRLEKGLPLNVVDVALSWRPHAGQLFTMGLIMMFLHLAWERIAMLIYAAFFNIEMASWEHFVSAVLFSTDGIPFLLVGTAMGGVLAAVAFAIGVVAFPMLMERDCGTLRAITTSICATLVNWRVLIGWGALIVLFTAAGIATFCIGLIVTMPLIGHASWHAYRDLVETGNE
ncbi:DUF2189 domain-containing protein [Dongia sp.]|uniref:DUF2189 domain-containing protein n=1 Tax=Dongia sp. TaxID=1977262 RepID=UPI0035B0BD52